MWRLMQTKTAAMKTAGIFLDWIQLPADLAVFMEAKRLKAANRIQFYRVNRTNRRTQVLVSAGSYFRDCMSIEDLNLLLSRPKPTTAGSRVFPRQISGAPPPRDPPFMSASSVSSPTSKVTNQVARLNLPEDETARI